MADVTLTEAEREALRLVFEDYRRGRFTTPNRIIAAVERIKRQAMADALREAAGHVQESRCGYANPRIRSQQAIRRWLRDRADQIEAGS